MTQATAIDLALPTPATKLIDPARIVDVIVYTATLNSDARAIDPFMDTLRTVTAQGKTAYNAADLDQLHRLQAQLENHLIHQERVRAFDYESLHQHILQHFRPGSRSRWLVVLTLVMTLGIPLLGLASQLIAVHASPLFKITISIAVTYSLYYLASAGLFYGGLRQLTPEGRRAYAYICISTLYIGCTFMSHPLSGLLGIEALPFLSTVLIAILIPANYLQYLAVHHIANWAHVDPQLLRRRHLIIAVLGVSVVTVGLFLLVYPLVNNSLPAHYALASMLFQGVSTAVISVSAVILYQACRSMNAIYARASRALLYGIVASVISSLAFTAYWLLVGAFNDGIWLRVVLLTLLISSFGYLQAGYRFNNTHRY